MTDNIIMEEISKTYLETIANGKGYFNSVARDYGTDMTIRRANYCSTKKRYLTIGKSVDLQIKAVSEKYVEGINDPKATTIKYVLEAKNYNDLVTRANEGGICMPLYLCVVILPDDKINWYSLNTNELIIRKCAFWYQVPDGAVETKNTVSVTIHIPKSNVISESFYDDIFNSLS